MIREIKFYGETYTFEETPEAKDAIYEKILKWIEKHNASCWEMIGQNDDCQIDASSLIGDIVDNCFNFKDKDLKEIK